MSVTPLLVMCAVMIVAGACAMGLTRGGLRFVAGIVSVGCLVVLVSLVFFSSATGGSETRMSSALAPEEIRAAWDSVTSPGSIDEVLKATRGACLVGRRRFRQCVHLEITSADDTRTVLRVRYDSQHLFPWEDRPGAIAAKRIEDRFVQRIRAQESVAPGITGDHTDP